MDKISIIMPVFNSERTLKKSIDSILTQSVSIPLELVIVDDFSSDGSVQIMESYERTRENVRVIRLPQNFGGGRARNEGIQKAAGNLLMCFDSDDILPRGMLAKMINFLRENALDGVLFEESKFFISNPFLSISSKNSPLLLSHEIKFEDLFQDASFLTQVNFLYTRKAYEKAGGYPTAHGFDTQGFGFRFLAATLSARICPGSYYFHRQGFAKSYFEREYERGALSLNYYLILEEVLFRFNTRTIEQIFSFDVFKKNSISGENLPVLLRSLLRTYGSDMFSPYTSWREWKSSRRPRGVSLGWKILEAVDAYTRQDYEKSLFLYQEMFEQKKWPLFLSGVVRSLGKKCIDPEDTALFSIQLEPRVSIVTSSLAGKVVRMVRSKIAHSIGFKKNL